MPVRDRILIRRDTAANWTATNPTLASGELGFETDTRKGKLGDGATVWTGLAYAISSGGGDNTYVNTVATADADFNDSSPAAPGSGLNVKWQMDLSVITNVSAYVPYSGSLTVSAGNLELSGDSAAPGNSKYYGTSAGGVKGYHSLPAGGSPTATTVEIDLGTPKTTGKFTITDASISGTSKVLCWQAPGPYTGKGTRADEAAMQQVSVISVEPGTGSAVVQWQTPPTMTMRRVSSASPKLNAAGATFDRLENQRWPDVFEPVRLGKVRGNVKFSYMILT